jgi:hypothetical protein
LNKKLDVTDAVKPEETTSGAYRFRENVAPKATTTFKVRESSPLETTYQLSNLTTDQIALFVRQKTINPEIEAAFRKIVEQKNRVAALDEELARGETETQKIYDDQQPFVKI